MGIFLIDKERGKKVDAGNIAVASLLAHLAGWTIVSVLGIFLLISFQEYLGIDFSEELVYFQMIGAPLGMVSSFPLSIFFARYCAKRGVFGFGAALTIGPLVGVIAALLPILGIWSMTFFSPAAETTTEETAKALLKPLAFLGIASLIGFLYATPCSMLFWRFVQWREGGIFRDDWIWGGRGRWVLPMVFSIAPVIPLLPLIHLSLVFNK